MDEVCSELHLDIIYVCTMTGCICVSVITVIGDKGMDVNANYRLSLVVVATLCQDGILQMVKHIQIDHFMPIYRVVIL